MLAEHSTPWPSWRMGKLVHQVSMYLQAKGLSNSNMKRVVMMQARTCNPRMSPSKVERFTTRPPSHLSPLPFPSFSDARITWIYLVKKGFHCWARTCDLECHRPAWSHGAIEASEVVVYFRDLESSSSSSLLLTERIGSLLEHSELRALGWLEWRHQVD